MTAKSVLNCRGITLIELVVVLIIVGILAAIAMPMFPRAMEATKAKEAVAALEQIRTGERIYRVEENTYWPLDATEGDMYLINETLRVFLDTTDDRNWNYFVVAASPGGVDIFFGIAARTSGVYQGKLIRINQDGVVEPGPTNPWPLPLPK